MIFSKNNCKNKKCKINLSELKNTIKNTKIRYIKLHATKIDKIVSSATNKLPNIFPEYSIYNNRHFLCELAGRTACKINKQIVTYKAINSMCCVDFIAYDCANQVLRQKQIDIFKYVNEKYGSFELKKKEKQIFPYLLCEKFLLVIVQLLSVLARLVSEVEYGAKYNGTKIRNFSYANIYGLLKYNKNMAKIGHNLKIDYKKCVFLFIDKLINIENKLNIFVKYLVFLSNKFHI